MNIYRLINECLLCACMSSILLYMLLIHANCIIFFYRVGGFMLKRNLSNFLLKIINTCIDYSQFVIIKIIYGS